MCSGFSSACLTLGGVVFFLIFFVEFFGLFLAGSFLKVFNSFADARADFRELAGPENNHDNYQNNDEFRHSQSEHISTSAERYVVIELFLSTGETSAPPDLSLNVEQYRQKVKLDSMPIRKALLMPGAGCPDRNEQCR
jgi:hypothetical protein